MEPAVINLIAAQYGSISDIEIVWTLIAAVGICFSLFNMRDAWFDYKSLPVEIMNGRRAVATLSIRMEVTRLLIQMVFLVIGIFAFTEPDRVDQLALPLKAAIFSVIVRWGLILCGGLILYQSYANYRLRRNLLRPYKPRLVGEILAGDREEDEVVETVKVEIVNPEPVDVNLVNPEVEIVNPEPVDVNVISKEQDE